MGLYKTADNNKPYRSVVADPALQPMGTYNTADYNKSYKSVEADPA